MHRSGLPTGLAEAGTTTEYDAALRASHHAGVDRIDAGIGTPVLTVTAPDGDERSFFGPVLDTVPARADALRLWDAIRLMAGIPALRELKA
ncbi:hypothetical protein [Streptomyces sp. NPDC048295]|uniref:mycothiol-dependent nitroreductase Rv2466c family protein n=1 Tax=Streptomyces sp. NPDC048295 TaxID=3154617 RepID=UPI003433A500